MESATDNCCVKVALHIRPLIPDERLLGCIQCLTLVSAKPQVQLGTHSFTFDHVYGPAGSPSSSMFKECVSPLVDGLFQGYNATVLAYGQTGSGKTYTMGTGFKDGFQTGLIPKVMKALFSKIETLKQSTEFRLHVSFIEILKEEVRDLLNSTLVNKTETNGGHAVKTTSSPGKAPIQIRESSNGVITLAGSTERSVETLAEMADCLEQGSLSRATGSTKMNNQSSRSHAIFTITLEHIRKVNTNTPGDSNGQNELINEDYLCAKLHLVDLAGSERAKRTGSDGVRFKEGVHINKGLLALGNVISALGDQKKRKESLHVPYRDSKLTRLLQDSLGGNSRTVMIACVSPADINAEETLNTLKYANRARKIQNKPVVNRDPIANEMLKMRQQLEVLQAELSAQGDGGASSDIQVMKDKIAWLEATNENLCRELHFYRSRYGATVKCQTDNEVCGTFTKTECRKRGSRSMDSSDYIMTEAGDSVDSDDDEVSKEWEHTILQDSMDKELHELNKQLEQKESEMKLFGGFDTMALKQHFGKKIKELEDEKRSAQKERDPFFRQCKSSREKELLQLRKEGKKNEYERHKLQVLNQRQKMVLHRKTKEAAIATKRLKELIEARKSARDNTLNSNGNVTNEQMNEKSLQRWLDHELEVMVNVQEVRHEYQKQSQIRAALAEELSVLRQADESALKELSPPRGKNGFSRACSMAPNARMKRILSLENMLSISSNSLVSMSSQLSEAEERPHAFSSCGRWNQLRSMSDAKNLLQYMFNSLADSRFQLWEKDIEMKEMEEQLQELVGFLKQSEGRRKEITKELKLRDAVLSSANNSQNPLKHLADEMSGSLSPVAIPAQKQLKYTGGIANSSVRESAAFIDHTRKMASVGALTVMKLGIGGYHGAKLWRWKRSHHQCHLQFKWKWQKPWKLSEWIRHSDETIMRPKPQGGSPVSTALIYHNGS